MELDIPRLKRLLDLVILLTAAVFIVPALALCAFAILVLDGRPIFYKSRRRVFRQRSITIWKFRTMRRDAEQIANRKTVAVDKTRFLNIAPDSPLYTPVGRWLERLMLTEMPQLMLVLKGEMSLVGNRPLPDDVVAALRDQYPGAELRFEVPAGLTGPVQLIGRDDISDADRLRIEGAYSLGVRDSYRPALDLKILLYTVLVGLVPSRRFSVAEVERMMAPARASVAGLVPSPATRAGPR